MYTDQPNRSPWTAQFPPEETPQPLTSDETAEVVIVGAGIAGVATAYFALRETGRSVLLIERDRPGRGASGNNAGQLTTYFERPLHEMADEFGAESAVAAQRDFDDAHGLLDLMVAETGATVRIERFVGHLGMFTLNHVLVHLRGQLLRRRGGLRVADCRVSEEAEFLDRIPAEFAGLFTVVPQREIAELLQTDDDRYCAVISEPKGCANSGLLVQQVLSHLRERYPDRFRFADRTPVERITIGADGAVLEAGGHRVRADQVVLCTNGYVDHRVEDGSGRPVLLHPDQRINGVVGYMTAAVEEQRREPAALSYIRNAEVGGEIPYLYVTRRTYDRRDDTVTLSCLGGPEKPDEQPDYDPNRPFPADMLAAIDQQVRPVALPARPPGQPYEFQWHGLMGYSNSMIRVVGRHPGHQRLLYNLGCNGVGFLPSIFGGHRVARIIAGEDFGPSIFDPR